MPAPSKQSSPSHPLIRFPSPIPAHPSTHSGMLQIHLKPDQQAYPETTVNSPPSALPT
ncbi:hypothetical protein BJY04DRAFT_203080 [Aspergillus karnatakaensis]|uniref:uncharacterized protein n=1 Tax=Aspergillus karnatakaensis TaxID=1810916 RepID=UPI003CCCFED3